MLFARGVLFIGSIFFVWASGNNRTQGVVSHNEMKNMAENPAKHLLRYWFPVLFYCTAIFIQSSFPGPKVVSTFFHIDKALHFFAYAFLGILFLRALRNSAMGHREGLVFMLAILLTTIYGGTDEWHQSFVPGRTPDWWDLLADLLGGWFGVFVYQRLLRRNPRHGSL